MDGEPYQGKDTNAERLVTVLTLIDTPERLEIDFNGPKPLLSASGKEPQVAGVVVMDNRHIEVIDFNVSKGLPPQPITEESCIVVIENSQTGRKASKGAIFPDMTEVLKIINHKL